MPGDLRLAELSTDLGVRLPAVLLVPELGPLEVRRPLVRPRLTDRVIVVGIVRFLREEEDLLVRPCRPVLRGVGHRVRLIPDNLRPEVPSGVPEGEGDSPGNPDEVLRLQAARPCRGPPVARGIAEVRVAEVQPEGPILPEDAVDLVEDGDDPADVCLDAILSPDLHLIHTGDDARAPADAAFRVWTLRSRAS